jgi:hypothetical protein
MPSLRGVEVDDDVDVDVEYSFVGALAEEVLFLKPKEGFKFIRSDRRIVSFIATDQVI